MVPSKMEAAMTIPDPIGDFSVVSYDEKTRRVTIEIDPRILKDPNQVAKLADKCAEIMVAGPNVDAVDVVPRD